MTNYVHQPDILLQQEYNLGNTAAADELLYDPAKIGITESLEHQCQDRNYLTRKANRKRRKCNMKLQEEVLFVWFEYNQLYPS